MNWWKLAPPEGRRFGLLAAGGLVYVLPILLADRYYQDDLARSLYGATGWAGDGRPLTEWLMELLAGGGTTVVDLSPLPMLLGLAALAYALTLYARQAFPTLRESKLATLALGFVLVHPFAMANLSYKFDCLTMLLALALCFVLYALPRTLGGPRLALAGAVAALLVMGLYQPASGMFLVLAGIWFVFWLVDWLGSGGPLGERLGDFWPEVWRLGGVAVGALVYLAAVAPRFVDSEGWRREASRTVGGSGTLTTIVTNILSAAYYVRERLRMAPMLYRVVLAVTVVGAVLAVLWQFWRTSTARPVRKVLGSIVLAGAPFGMLLASYLPLVALQNMECSARMFLAFGGTMLFIGLLWLRALPRRRAVAGVLLGVCLFCQTCCMYAYGSALKSQKNYETYLVTQIAHDCESINGAGNYSQLSFVGTAPRPREVQMICTQYPFLGELIQPCFTNNTWLGGAWVYHYLQYDLEIVGLTDEDTAACTDEHLLLQNSRYACYESGNKILVMFL